MVIGEKLLNKWYLSLQHTCHLYINQHPCHFSQAHPMSNIKLILSVVMWLAFSGINHHVRAYDWKANFSPPDQIHFEVNGSAQLCASNDNGLTRIPIDRITMKRDHRWPSSNGEEIVVAWPTSEFPDTCIFDVPITQFNDSGEIYQFEVRSFPSFRHL